jgi:hypothetical protein
MTPVILKAITRAPMDKDIFWNTLLEVGFLDLHEDGAIEVHGFYDANSQLIANWKNGKKGGRPKKKIEPEKPIQNPSVTHREPIERVERKEGGEEKEKVEKQDEVNGEAGSGLSPSPGKKPFWFGTSYAGQKPPPIANYDELHAFNDPILAAMAVTQEQTKALYGFLVKGCNRCLEAGIDSEAIRNHLFTELEKLLGEIKQGERKRGMDAAKTLVARTGEYFDQMEVMNPENSDALENSIATLSDSMSC